MNADDMSNRPPGESGLFREVFDLADELVERITDDEVEARLRRILRAQSAGGQGLPKLTSLPAHTTTSVRGVLFVHSAPGPLCPHVEWAVAGVLGVPISLPWASQSAAPGTLRAELAWDARPGTAGAIASALAGWNRLRFEVTEEASPGCDAIRYAYTPAHGMFSCVTAANGDVMISEGRLRAAMTVAACPVPGRQAVSLEVELARLLGQPWDDELEPFRRAADSIRWLKAGAAG